jgi:hypothetical protein
MPADVAVDDPDGIDSTCHATPHGAEGPADVTCDGDAVSYVFRPAGHRVYLCRDHADDVTRFGDDAFADGHPTAVTCTRCLRYTPRHRVDADRICTDCQTTG